MGAPVGGALGGTALVAILLLALCYHRRNRRRKTTQVAPILEGPNDAEGPGSSQPVPGSPPANGSARPASLVSTLPRSPPEVAELHQRHVITTPLSSDVQSLGGGSQLISPYTVDPVVTERRLSTGQVEFVHDLYRMNVPAPAIADVMDRMLREGEGSVAGSIASGDSIARRNYAQVTPEVSPPSYDFKLS